MPCVRDGKSFSPVVGDADGELTGTTSVPSPRAFIDTSRQAPQPTNAARDIWSSNLIFKRYT